MKTVTLACMDGTFVVNAALVGKCQMIDDDDDETNEPNVIHLPSLPLEYASLIFGFMERTSRVPLPFRPYHIRGDFAEVGGAETEWAKALFEGTMGTFTTCIAHGRNLGANELVEYLSDYLRFRCSGY